MDHEITVPSPFIRAINSDRFAADPIYQHQLMLTALKKALEDPFEQSRDLRGAEVVLKLHDDGLFVTVKMGGDPNGGALLPVSAEMFEKASKMLAAIETRRPRPVENVPLPEYE